MNPLASKYTQNNNIYILPLLNNYNKLYHTLINSYYHLGKLKLYFIYVYLFSNSWINILN